MSLLFRKQHQINAKIKGKEWSRKAKSVGQFLQVVETNAASPFIEELFMRKFNDSAPDFPRHFIALYRTNTSTWVPIAYVHYTAYNHDYLCGGLVMNDRLYRHVHKPHREMLKSIGGIAELLLKESMIMLSDFEAVWGHVGDKQSKVVTLRVGFEETHHQYIMAFWNKHFTERKKRKKAEHIATIGLF